jgi:hypothetical protein
MNTLQWSVLVFQGNEVLRDSFRSVSTPALKKKLQQLIVVQYRVVCQLLTEVIQN